MKLKEIVFICVTVIFVVATCLFYIYNNNNNYVLKINGEKVNQAEFETYLGWQKRYMELNVGGTIDWTQLDEAEGVPNIDIAKDLTKDFMTDTKVKLQEAKKRKISLTDDEKLTVGLTVSSSYSKLTETYDLSMDEWTKIYEENAIIEKLALEVCKETLHYDARHILFKTEGKTDEEKAAIKVTAQSVLDRIKNGEEMSTLASELSEDDGSKANGGLYTTIVKGAFVKEFEDAALSLNEGDLYPELVESQFGYHIIKLEKLNSEVTVLNNSLYNEFLTIAQGWIDSAVVEEGPQYYLIGVEDSNSEDIKNHEDVLPDEVEPDAINPDIQQ